MPKTVTIDDATSSRLTELTTCTGRPAPTLVKDAVEALHRSQIGEAPRPGVPRIPFKKLGSDNDADVVLRQLDPKYFRLEEGFRFVAAERTITVPPGGDATDLASVPGLLTWLVPRYGRHTLPALLHDYLVRPGMPTRLRAQADETFRDAMGATAVPFVMRWAMWAAVSVATLLARRAWPVRVLVGTWFLYAGLAAASVNLRVVGWLPSWLDVPLLPLLASPLLVSLLWGRRYRIGLITAYGLMLVLWPVVVVSATLVVYGVLEWVAQRVLRLVRRMGADVAVNPVRLSRLPTAAPSDRAVSVLAD